MHFLAGQYGHVHVLMFLQALGLLVPYSLVTFALLLWFHHICGLSSYRLPLPCLRIVSLAFYFHTHNPESTC